MKDCENNGIPCWKRTLDVVAILLALPCMLPLALAIAAVIRATSTGPVVFKQERVGYYGRRFMCLKFRTMHCNAGPVMHQSHMQTLMDSDVPMLNWMQRGIPGSFPLAGCCGHQDWMNCRN